MKITARLTALLALVTVTILLPNHPAFAQYMFIDTDGNGVHDSLEYLRSGTTSVDIYLVTDKNADGSPAPTANCGGGSFTINSYEVILRSNGALTYGSWTDNLSFPVNLGAVQAGPDFYVGRGSSTNLPPGKYKLGSLALSGVAIGSSMFIVSSTTASPTAQTAFGSLCVGVDFDNTLKLGTDWYDTYGTFGYDPPYPPRPIGPVISVSPLSHDFGRVNVGSSASFAYLVENYGDADLHITSTNSTGFPAFLGSFPGPAATATIPPGGSTAFTASFQPATSGSQSTTFTFQSDASNGATYSVVASGSGNAAPVLDPIGDKSANAFVTLSFTVAASDPESDVLTLSQTDLPVGATFDTNTGVFSWTPGPSDAGSYAMTFSASDGLLSDSETITITVNAGNNPPVANPGGPYSGVTDQPVTFDGSGSSDPDGGNLSYAWHFGDGASGSGASATHTYAIAGNYLVTLTVTDEGTPALSNSATTGVSILNLIPAGVNLKLAGAGFMKTSGGGSQVAGIETTAIPATEINPATVKMSTTFPGAGTVNEISPTAAKGSSIGDLDGDNVPDLVVTFSRASIHDLLGNVPNNTEVTLVMAATSTTGVPVRGTTTVRVKSSGGALAVASAAPNPFNPSTKTAWTLKTAGMTTVKIYSLEGRLVKTIHDGYSQAGTTEAYWNGLDNAGRKVPSGVYFLTVQSAGTKATQKLYLMK